MYWTWPAIFGSSPASVSSVVVLPGAVRAEEGDDLTGMHLEVYAAHGGEVAVPGDEPAYPQHAGPLWHARASDRVAPSGSGLSGTAAAGWALLVNA